MAVINGCVEGDRVGIDGRVEGRGLTPATRLSSRRCSLIRARGRGKAQGSLPVLWPKWRGRTPISSRSNTGSLFLSSDFGKVAKPFCPPSKLRPVFGRKPRICGAYFIGGGNSGVRVGRQKHQP